MDSENGHSVSCYRDTLTAISCILWTDPEYARVVWILGQSKDKLCKLCRIIKVELLLHPPSMSFSPCVNRSRIRQTGAFKNDQNVVLLYAAAIWSGVFVWRILISRNFFLNTPEAKIRQKTADTPTIRQRKQGLSLFFTPYPPEYTPSWGLRKWEWKSWKINMKM